MNRFGKLTAGLLTLSLTASLAGCSADTSWAYRSANAEITSGMYIGLSIAAVQSASMVEGVDTSLSLFDQEIEGYDGLTWVTNETEKLARQYLATEEKFLEMGLSFTEEEQAAIDNYAENYWAYVSSYYEDEGCGQTSFTKLVTNTEKQNKIFDAIYGEGGEQEVSEEELRKAYEENYVKASYFVVPLTDDEGEKLEDSKLDARKKQAELLLERIQNGENFETVKADYEASEEETEEETSSETAESSEATESSETTESSEAAESSETTESSEITESSEATESSEVAESSEATESSETAETSETEATDTSEYMYKEGSYPSLLLDALFEALDGDVGMTEDTNYIYIWQKQSLDDTGFEGLRSTILSQLKGEDFTALIEEWATALDMTANEPSLKKHSPKNLDA